jgi:hypothetical protein
LTVANYQRTDPQLISDLSKEILKDNSLTFAEKALSIKSALDASALNTSSSSSSASNTIKDSTLKPLRAGDIAIVSVDLAMAQDSTGPLAIKS